MIATFIQKYEGEEISDEMRVLYPKLCGLLQRCFKSNPKARPKIEEVMQNLEKCRDEFK